MGLCRARGSPATTYGSYDGLHLQFQSAYKQIHSTESALLKVKNDILMNMDAQKVILLALLDLSAAFDTLCHEILLGRLEWVVGVGGKALDWFKWYLKDRSQRGAVNSLEVTNFPFQPKQGVP